MAEIKISDLTSATEPSGEEVFAVVQSNTTHKTTINSLKSALVDNLSTGAPTWDSAGNLTAGYDIIAGGNHDGRVALTINDGYGNANLTFNHTDGIPDKSGSSARIAVNVDSNSEVMDFQLKGSVNAGSALPLTSVLKLYDNSIQLLMPTTLSSNGNADTSLVNKGYIDTALTSKSNTGHTHTQYSLNTHLHDDRYSQLGHGHAIGSISNLQTILNGKIGEDEINTAHFTFANNTLSLDTIQEGQIETDAITETKIEDGAVTPAKLSNGGPSWSTARLNSYGYDFYLNKNADSNVANSTRSSGLAMAALSDRLNINHQGQIGDYTQISTSGNTKIEVIGPNSTSSADNQIYHSAEWHVFNHTGNVTSGVSGAPANRVLTMNSANGTATLDNSTVSKINNAGNKAIATKEYVDSLINSSALTGLLSTPLNTNYPAYYVQGTVISGSLTGVWSGFAVGKFTAETITIDLRNISTGSTTVSSFYSLSEDVGGDDVNFSVTRTFERENDYTIPSSGLYQLSTDATFTTTSGATATPPA